jgi:6-methylsalicylate decarboxylase
MKNLGIRTAILSLTAPGIEVAGSFKAQRALARKVNEEAASMRDNHPESIGFFATVPSPLDMEGALAELAYALDELNADGVTLLSRYGDDMHYLGHPDFKPLWAELNRRKAVVFVHPTHTADSRLVNDALPQPVLDYPHETARMAMDLITSNRKKENPDVKIILSHAGGTLPILVDRAAKLINRLPGASQGHKNAREIEEEAKTFYVDLALSTRHDTLKYTLGFFPKEQILFGSDFPYAEREVVEEFTAQLKGFNFGGELQRTIYERNGLELFPRLKKEHSRL